MGSDLPGSPVAESDYLDLSRHPSQGTRSPGAHPGSVGRGGAFLTGNLVYMILRPRHTLEDEYQRTLEEEALLQSIEETPVCPGCGRRTQTDWMVCPNCHTKLKKPCLQCGKLMELPWNLCPYCSTPTPGMRRENLSLDDAMQSLTPAPLEFDDDLELIEIPG